MDRYLSARKPATASLHTKSDHLALKKPSSAAITRHLLNTLADKSNPITHSNIYERSGRTPAMSRHAAALHIDTVVSATTGHQRGEGRTPHAVPAKAYFQGRSKKLSLRRGDETPKGILTNVRVYIDGYLSGTTDIEMRRLIAQAGGITLLAPSGATHIVTSRQLSGSKTRRILTTHSEHPAHVVKPEWVIDSIVAGRRLKEFRYTLLKFSGTRNLVDALKSGGG